MNDLESARSFLFAPGDDDAKLRRALKSDADVVIADLEDAVAPQRKMTARSVVKSVLRDASSARLVLLRINALSTRDAATDLRLARELPIDGLMVPKATPAAMGRLETHPLAVVALVETAEGLRDSAQLAELSCVVRLALGSIDLAADVGMQTRDDGLELVYARSKLAIDSAAAGRAAPIDTVFTAFRDTAGFEGQALLARSLGMGGKLCIHPGQVPVANRVFAPTPDEVAAAQVLISAYDAELDSGKGVTGLDGDMVDMALVRRARRILRGVR